MNARCNICNTDEFLPGPGGRKSVTGKAPRCAGCDSLERHRIIRAALERMRMADWADGRAIQFSSDKSVDPDWFREFEVSTYPGPDAIDICDIDRPDSAYDFVFVNHVLEHVRDDARALRELLRVTSERGMLLVTVPAPFNVSITRDWGFPDPEQHGHYRHYGRDAIPFFASIDPTVSFIQLVSADPVTEDRDFIFVYTRNDNLKRHILEQAWIQKDVPVVGKPVVTEHDVAAVMPRAFTTTKPTDCGRARHIAMMANHLNDLFSNPVSMLEITNDEPIGTSLSRFCSFDRYIPATAHELAGGPPLSAENGYDVVLLKDGSGFPCADPARVLLRCRDALRADGYLIIETLNAARHLNIGKLIAGNAAVPLDAGNEDDMPARVFAPNEIAQLVAAAGFDVILHTADTGARTPAQDKIVEWVTKNVSDDLTLHRDTIGIIARKRGQTGGESTLVDSRLHESREELNARISVARTAYELMNRLRAESATGADARLRGFPATRTCIRTCAPIFRGPPTRPRTAGWRRAPASRRLAPVPAPVPSR